ncbi:MAG TPA: ACT domain-containing protein [Anaeromyxobacteraceae bacterium]|nr:ACT domain-containing protein [Anaeromyxobacteraceae bacterium]
MPRAKALKVKVPDRPGLLGEIASALGANGINLRAMHGYTDGGQGVVCLVVDKLAPANKVLSARGLRPEQEELLEVDLLHKPGTLGEAAKVLGDAGVNIKYVFLGPASARRATAFFAVSDMAAALKALG